MRKICTLFVLLLTVGIMSAQGVIKITTEKAIDEDIAFNLYSTSLNDPFTIDWGDGSTTTHNISPDDIPYFQRVSGKVRGSVITITGNIVYLSVVEQAVSNVSISNQSSLKILELTNNVMTGLAFEGDVAPLERIDLSGNQLTNSTEENATMGLEIFGSTLQSVNLSNNNLICLNIEALVNLKELYVKNNPSFTSLFVAQPEESRPIEKIDISNGELSHFYPVSMPMLTSLHLSNNVLMEDFVIDDYYPALQYLSIDGNYIPAVDVRACRQLEQFDCSRNQLSIVDVSQNTQLTHLYCSRNQLTYLDVYSNVLLTTLHCDSNQIKEVDIINNSKLQNIKVSGNPITHIDLTNAYNLQRFEAAATQCDYFYFNYVNPSGRFNYVDVRDNPNMTAYALNCMFKTMPIHYGSSYSPTLLISGSNGETSDTSYPNSEDMGWKTDINGDGTASTKMVDVTIDATNTGGTIELSGCFGGINTEQNYTLTEYATDHGTFAVVQWDTPYYQKFREVKQDAYVGVPIVIMAYPHSGYRFESVEVDGKIINSNWFVVNDNCSIKVNFAIDEKVIAVTTTQGIPMSFQLGGPESINVIEIDWGNGSRQQYEIPQYSDYTIAGGRIEGSSSGTTIKIYGNVTYANFESEPYFVGWDNQITAIDLSKNKGLQYLDLYWNPITDINLDGQNDLQVLGVSYTAIKELDLSGAPNLLQLECYSDGYGFEEDGIAMLSKLDLSKTPKLRYLDAKNNKLETIEFTNTPDLSYINVSNNNLTHIDVSQVPLLWYLYATDNNLEQIDLSQNTQLMELSLGQNKLTEIDLSINNSVRFLFLENNNITALDVSNMSELCQLKIGGNGMTACQLSDLYYSLPQYPELTQEELDAIAGYPLNVSQAGEVLPNDAYGADATIATYKGWSINIQGNGSGCETAYIDIVPSENGSVRLYDVDNNEILSGTKTLRNSTITIEAVPYENYCYNSLLINESEVVEGTTFMIGAYARVQAVFNADNAVEDKVGDETRVYAVAGAINVTTTSVVDVDIFALDGRVVGSARVHDKLSFEMPDGVYVVRVVNNAEVNSHTVVVR
ncbi:MAG: hypothetical protein J6J06_00040 [Bacteroidaceae bacterium]|nr:hypothetical protein [Bacteroidaceae bacterium]